MKITAAGNTLIPAILALEQLGFDVSLREAGTSKMFVATRGNESYSAEDPVTVLGLVKLVELKGQDWRASDSDIDGTIEKYHLG